MAGGDEAVVLDQKTAERVLKATRMVESMGAAPEASRNKPQFSIEQIVVPRSGPDSDGFYTCDIYIVDDPEAGSYTQVATGQKARLLPTSL